MGEMIKGGLLLPPLFVGLVDDEPDEFTVTVTCLVDVPPQPEAVRM